MKAAPKPAAGRAQAVAPLIPAIADAITASCRRFCDHDALLASALRDHAGELIDAADLIDARWRFESRRLLGHISWRRPVTLGDLIEALHGWPALGENPTREEARASVQRFLAETGLPGIEGVEALLLEALQ